MRISDWSSDVCSSDLQEDDDPYPVHRIPYSAGDVPGWDLLRPVPYRRSAPASAASSFARPGQERYQPNAVSLPLHLQYFPIGLKVLRRVRQRLIGVVDAARSEERRLGKGGGSTFRSGWWPCH